MDTKAVTGLNLSNEELDEATRRLAFFAPTGSKKYVEELYEFLAQQALASLEPGVWFGHQIYAKLSKLTGIRVEYEELIAAVGRLVQQHIVACTMDSVFMDEAKFAFEDLNHREIILKATEVQHHKEKQVIEDWKKETLSLFPELKPSQIDTLESDLREFMYRITSQSSVDTVLLYYAGHREISELAGLLDADSLDRVLPRRSDELLRIRAEVLPNFFRTKDLDRKQFIDGLLQSTFILHMIQLDPRCSALVQSQIMGGTVYLDTNFVFRLIGLHSPEMFFASRTLVDLSRKLNYRLVITPITLEEYKHALADNLERLRNMPQLPSDLLNTVVDIADDQDPIISYYRKVSEINRKQHGVYVSPTVYIDYFSEITTLLEPYGIEVSDELCDTISAQSNELSTEASRLKRFVDDRRYSRNKNYQELSTFVAEHDAFHRLLILRLRAGYDGASFSDIPYWFLTCDSKLPAYDRVRRVAEGLTTPFCVMTAQWLQTLRPFSPRLNPEAIVDSISSPLLGSFGPIPNSVILDVAGRLQMYEKYNAAVGKLAMKRQFLLQFAQAHDEAQKEELIQNVFADYAADVENLKEAAEEARLEAESRAQDLAEKTNDLQTQVTALKELIQNSKEEQLVERNSYLETIKQVEINLQTASQSLEEERRARVFTEQELEQKRKDQAAKETEAESLKVTVALLSKRQEQSRRFLTSFVVLATYLLILTAFRPWIEGGVSWFILTGLLVVLYIGGIILFQPQKRARIGKLFLTGFPFIIAFSIALPLGKESLLLELFGLISNVGGVAAFFLFVYKE